MEHDHSRRTTDAEALPGLHREAPAYSCMRGISHSKDENPPELSHAGGAASFARCTAARGCAQILGAQKGLGKGRRRQIEPCNPERPETVRATAGRAAGQGIIARAEKSDPSGRKEGHNTGPHY